MSYKPTIEEQKKIAFDALYKWSTLRLLGAMSSPQGLVTPVHLERSTSDAYNIMVLESDKLVKMIATQKV